MTAKSIKELIVVWDNNSDRIEVQCRRYYGENKRQYQSSWGGCNKEVQDEKEGSNKLKMLVMSYALSLIIQDGCNPIAVNKAFSKIKEYRDGLDTAFFNYTPIYDDD